MVSRVNYLIRASATGPDRQSRGPRGLSEKPTDGGRVEGKGDTAARALRKKEPPLVEGPGRCAVGGVVGKTLAGGATSGG